MAHAKNCLFLALFVPTGLFVWSFSPIVLFPFFFLSALIYTGRYGFCRFGTFIKTWGLFALFWSAFSFAASYALEDALVSEALCFSGILFFRLLTLFLWTAFLDKETTPAGLSYALALFLKPILGKKAFDVQTAFLLTASSFATKKAAFEKIARGVHLRFGKMSRLFRLKMLLIGLLKTVKTDSEAHAQALFLRGLAEDKNREALPSVPVYVWISFVLLTALEGYIVFLGRSL